MADASAGQWSSLVLVGVVMTMSCSGHDARHMVPQPERDEPRKGAALTQEMREEMQTFLIADTWSQQENAAAELLRRADWQFYDGNFVKAVSLYHSLMREFAGTRQIDWRILERGDHYPLEGVGLEYLSRNPNYVDDYARVQLGRCYEAQGHKERGLRLWKEVIEAGKRQGIAESDVSNGLYLVFQLQRPLVLALRSRALCLTGMGRMQDALEAADEIGKLYPGAQELIDLFFEMKGLAGSSAAPVVQRLRIALKERETRVRESEAVALDKEFELRGIRAMRKRLGLSREPDRQ